MIYLSDWFAYIYPSLIWRVKTKDKKIYLTFDDGPIPEVTPAVLKILEETGWKATFFCVGENVEKYPELYQQIIDEGHDVGNHSFNHLKGFKSTNKAYVQNVQKTAQKVKSNLFRPPYGRMKNSQIKSLKDDYTIVMWDLLTRDYNPRRSPEKIMKRIKRRIRTGSIVVFHDSLKAEKNVLTVLPKALEYWTAEGYQYGLFE